MGEVAVKGHSLRQNVDLLAEILGAEGLERVVKRLNVDFRTALETGTLTRAGWYPVGWANEIHEVALREFPNYPDIPERIARLGVERDMSGIYGFLTRLVSPEFCIKQAPRILGTYFRGMEIESTVFGKGHAELRFTGTAGIGRLLWRDILAGTTRIFEEAGAREVLLRTRKGGREGDEEHVVELRWE